MCSCMSCTNLCGATHGHYTWLTKYYGLYPSHNALEVLLSFHLLMLRIELELIAVSSLCTLYSLVVWELKLL